MKNKLIFCENSVIKNFHSKISYHKEKHILSILSGTDLCPQIISDCENQLEISLVKGITLSQAIADNIDLFTVFEKLVQWIIQFNSITHNICLDDINLKNFIYSQSEDKIYGIDFECWHNGDNTVNFESVLAMIETVDFKDNLLQRKLYNHINAYILSTTGVHPVENFAKSQKEKIALRRKAMTFIRKSDCVIIAGGKSSRMGYPKGLLKQGDYTFMEHIIHNTAAFDKQYISANSDIYNDLHCEIIADNYNDIGPMGALQACLSKAEKEYVFFIPCDMPFITEETIFHLYSNFSTEVDALIFKTEDKAFPTVGVYKKSTLKHIEEQIKTGNYKMMLLLDKINTQYIVPVHPEQFRNINTPQDYNNI